MLSTTKFTVMNDSLEFLSNEWAYAKLKPNTSTSRFEPPTESTNRSSASSSELSSENTAVAAPIPIPKSPCTKSEDTPHTISIPELVLPSEANPYDPKEFYKTGCIMAMLLNEQKPPKSTTQTRELITTTKTPWKLGDDETERARKAAHREWEKSGAAACAGLAASRWYKADGEKKVAPKAVRPRRVSYKSRNDPAACEGLAASRWYGRSFTSRG